MNTFGNFNNMNMRGMNNNRLGYYSPIPQLPPQMPQLQQNQFYNNNQNGVSTNIEMIQGGEASVNALQLPNNSIYCYFDDNNDVIYIKEVDGNGRATVQAYDLVPKGRNQEPSAAPVIDTSSFVTKEQLDEISKQLSQQIADTAKKLNDFKAKVGSMNKKEGNK